MSLKKFCDAEQVEHKKLSGEEFDYSKIRYPWTELTEDEWRYQIYDVLSLVECIYSLLHKNGDTIYTIPFTNTGYVRRDARKALKNDYVDIRAQLPNEELYLFLKKAFRGGNTHANRYRANQEIKNVHNIDIVSSYPAVQLMAKYPMKPFVKVSNPSVERMAQLLERGKALLLKVECWGVTCREDCPVPYIPRSKVFRIMGEHYEDNGRILYMDYGEMYMTDIDFSIFKNQYMFDGIRITEIFYSTYGYLPESLREVIMNYYRQKTELKGVDDYFYMKSKNRLNSVYGMSATDCCKDSLVYDMNSHEFNFAGIDLSVLIERYHKNFVMAFQWGVWCTCHARARLQKLIDTVCEQNGFESFCYCDTDSVKYTGRKVDFSEFNNERIAECKETKSFAKDRKGKIFYLGTAEEEADYKTFKTLGAKKYVYTDSKGELHITIAGVNKAKGAKELEEKGGIASFKEGFTFKKGGGTESVYGDNISKVIQIDGHELEITDFLMIRDSTYTIGITDEYKLLLRDSMESLKQKGFFD